MKLATATASALAIVLISTAIWYLIPSEGLSREYVFRTRHVAGHDLSPDMPTAEWLLKVPNSFFVSMVGTNGGIDSGLPQIQGVPFFVGLDGVTDESNSKLVPKSGTSLQYQRDHFVSIRLSNTGAAVKMIPNVDCLSEDEFNAAAISIGKRNLVRSGCQGGDFPCTIYSHLQGWDMELSAAQPLYKNPARVCEIAKALVEKYTIHRDNIE